MNIIHGHPTLSVHSYILCETICNNLGFKCLGLSCWYLKDRKIIIADLTISDASAETQQCYTNWLVTK
jgi:hypothetical protein